MITDANINAMYFDRAMLKPNSIDTRIAYLRRFSVKYDVNKKPYLSLVLVDCFGREVVCNLFKFTDIGSASKVLQGFIDKFIQVSYTTSEWSGGVSISITKITGCPTQDYEGYNREEESVREYYEWALGLSELLGITGAYKDVELSALRSYVDEDIFIGKRGAVLKVLYATYEVLHLYYNLKLISDPLGIPLFYLMCAYSFKAVKITTNVQENNYLTIARAVTFAVTKDADLSLMTGALDFVFGVNNSLSGDMLVVTNTFKMINETLTGNALANTLLEDSTMLFNDKELRA